jgi:SEC-C motif-containing protein
VAFVERLVTVVDLRDQSGRSVSAHLYVVLDSGERYPLLDDRGWASSADIRKQAEREIEDTARMVVGPDGPGAGETDEEMQVSYWRWMEHKLRDAGISAEAGELRALPHDVELGESLHRRLECPCGSGLLYAACCGRLHAGRAAATAVELMRSRYSAFAVGDADYLLATWHPSTRPASIDLHPAVEWRRLRILGSRGGSEDDDRGTVEFVAHYWDSEHGEHGEQHENSSFSREDGRWLYIAPVP